MTTWLPRWIALLVLVLQFVPVVAALDDTEIARLIKHLGQDDFDKREAAATRLKEIGEPALDALCKAAIGGDAEARGRAKKIIVVNEQKLYREQLRFTSHTDEVWSISVSRDGQRVLTASSDKTLRLWDAHTGKQQRVFEGHTGAITEAALSADGKRVLSGSADGTVRLWDLTTGEELRQMTGRATEVCGVAFGPDGTAISGGSDGNVYLWDLNTSKNLGVFAGHIPWVRNVAYSDQAKLAATCGQDQSIRLWNLETGKEIRKLPTGKTGRHIDMAVCFSPDGKRLLLAGVDMSLRILDVATGKELMQIKNANAFCAAFSPDGKRIVSGGCFDYIVRVWDAATGKELRNYEGHTACVTSVTFFPDGQRIASASVDGTARIWRAPR